MTCAATLRGIMWKGRGTGTLLLKERPKLHLQVKIVLLLVIQGSATR